MALLALACTLNHVRVNRALRQPFGILALAGFNLEHFDEFTADNFALGFRIADTGQMAHELINGVDVDDVHAEVFGKHFHDHLAFVQAQQAVVDKYACQLVADRAMDQGCRNAAVDATGQTEDDFIAADLLANFLHCFGNVIRHIPV
ncbi:hypothetical protein D3C81_1829530 [compost metagenome]